MYVYCNLCNIAGLIANSDLEINSDGAQRKSGIKLFFVVVKGNFNGLIGDGL